MVFTSNHLRKLSHIADRPITRYHSHSSVQYGDGVVGGMVFDGPASSNYDYDLGPYLLSEVYGSQTAWQINAIAQANLQNRGGPPDATNILINGTAKNSNGQGSYNQVTITKGKKYRLRLVNISVDSYIRVSLDGHNMTVMTSDFVPINPFTTQWMLLAIGQRYDVVINANQASGNYWFRAESQTGCFSSQAAVGLAIWSYADATAGTPSSTAWPEPSGCLEPTMSPYWKQPVPSASFQNTLDTEITNAVVTPGGNSMVVWALNKPIWVDYAYPTLQYLMEGNTSYPATYNVINTNNEGSWNYWLITSDPNTFGLDHPIHLHGHDFFVIGQGSGTYQESSANLNFNNPVRRDTATLPAGGWLAIAFSSNNPGAWLMVSALNTFVLETSHGPY
jgi:FtsP/CotA-like multicopper oxidase with cupredoxin domain